MKIIEILQNIFRKKALRSKKSLYGGDVPLTSLIPKGWRTLAPKIQETLWKDRTKKAKRKEPDKFKGRRGRRARANAIDFTDFTN